MASEMDELTYSPGDPGVLPEVEADLETLTAIRRDIHAHPETAFEEVRTADIVAERLQEYGLEVHRGLARTGVVGTLKRGVSERSVGLRADMDALHIQETNDFDHRSRHDGKMHACGHDGHTTMLLGAAKHLAEAGGFDGTIHFIFQPAEENEGGGREMVEDGLFDRFPCEAVFGMHNIPGMEVGTFAVMPGPMMASFDIFEFTITGRGTHAAMPQTGTDTIVAGSDLVQALQTIVSRSLDPIDTAVVSVTKFHGGDTWNVLPETVTLGGTVRAFSPEVQDAIEAAMRRHADAVGRAYGVEIELRYDRRYPPTINSAEEAAFAADVLEAAFGTARVDRNARPVMAAEDFAFMLQAKPGAYVWIGNGVREGGCMVHNPGYDFNDAIIPMGTSYWVHLARRFLAKDE